MKHPKAIFKKLELSPKKRLGQNFLVSQKTRNEILKTVNLKKEDIILEIGPGLGVLTKKIAPKVKRVLAIEKDRVLAGWLREELKNFSNTEIITGDALKIVDNSKLTPGEDYKVVANLPFNISKQIIRKLLEAENSPKTMTLLVQKEVAESICASPRDMDLLSVAVQFYAQPRYVKTVPRSHFWPQPEVEAGLIKISTRKPPAVDKELFFKLVKAGFRHRRKQLATNLTKEFKLEKQEIIHVLEESSVGPRKRSEALSLKKWINLTKNIKKHIHP